MPFSPIISHHLCSTKERPAVGRHLHGNHRRRDLRAATKQKRSFPESGGSVPPSLWHTGRTCARRLHLDGTKNFLSTTESSCRTACWRHFAKKNLTKNVHYSDLVHCDHTEDFHCFSSASLPQDNKQIIRSAFDIWSVCVSASVSEKKENKQAFSVLLLWGFFKERYTKNKRIKPSSVTFCFQPLLLPLWPLE